MEGSPRNLVVLGVTLAALALAQLVVAYLLHPFWAAGLAAAMLAELVTGREAAIPVALATGIPPFMVALTSILQNLALAALLVPLAAASTSRLAQRETFAGRFMKGLHDSAMERLPRGASAGALFVFMLLPFVANGPVLAGLIGVLAGVPVRRLVLVLVGAVVITATAWTYAYAALNSALASVNPRLALIPAALAAGVAMVWLAAATRKAMMAGSTE